MIRNIQRYIISIIIRILLLFNRYGDKLINVIARVISESTPNYCNYKLRPKYAKAFVDSRIQTTTKSGELAIVIQGLPETKNDFTLETIKIYKRIFPGAYIIISTWDSVNTEILRTFEVEGCIVVINKTIKECGFGNVNYQIITTYSGLLKAKEIGAKYALKCRSDLRIYRAFAFEYLKSLLDLLPIDDNKMGIKGRIVTLSAECGQLFFPNWLQDFFYFGYTEDLIDLFNIPYSTRNVPSSGIYLRENYHPCTGDDMCKEEVPEVYITKRFLEKHIKVVDTVDEWWKVLGKYFIIIGFDELNALWDKYNRYSLNIRNCDYDGHSTYSDRMRNIDFTTFLLIRKGVLRYEPWMEKCRKEMLVFG